MKEPGKHSRIQISIYQMCKKHLLHITPPHCQPRRNDTEEAAGAEIQATGVG